MSVNNKPPITAFGSALGRTRTCDLLIRMELSPTQIEELCNYERATRTAKI